MLRIGHRGTCAVPSVRENTFAAFDLALELGCNGIELDVRRAKCGTPMVCHDAELGSRTISECVRADLPEIHTLQEVIARYGKRAFLDIDVKVRGLASEILLALGAHPPERGHVVSSFSPGILAELRARSAKIPLGFIFKNERSGSKWKSLPVEHIIPHESLMTEELVDEARKARRSIIVWTVNDGESIQRFAKMGVDGIISDQARLLVEFCGASRN